MPIEHIRLTKHARTRMVRRGVSLQDIAIVIEAGDHHEGPDEETGEVCLDDLNGRPLAVIYDKDQHELHGVFRIVTVIRRRCRR